MHKHHLIAVLGFSMATHAMFRNEADAGGITDSPTQPVADPAAVQAGDSSSEAAKQDDTSEVAPEVSNGDAGDAQPEQQAAPADSAAAESNASEAAPTESTAEEPEVVINPMKLYQCHKQVHAAKIVEVHPIAPSPGTDAEAYNSRLVIDNGDSIEVESSWVARHKPEVGGYYVVYEDGYTSYSPAKAFEDGYKEVGGSAVEDFISCLGFSKETPEHVINLVESSVKHALQHFGILKPQ